MSRLNAGYGVIVAAVLVLVATFLPWATRSNPSSSWSLPGLIFIGGFFYPGTSANGDISSVSVRGLSPLSHALSLPPLETCL